MGLYVPGVAGVATFYAAILGVGVWEATLKRRKIQQGQDQMLLGNRDLGLFFGVFSLIGKHSFFLKKNALCQALFKLRKVF